MERICRFCRRKAWSLTGDGEIANGAINRRPCICGKNHLACDVCYAERVKLIGEFPRWKEGMRECPSADAWRKARERRRR